MSIPTNTNNSEASESAKASDQVAKPIKAKQLRCIEGTRDYIGRDALLLNKVIDISGTILARYGYQQIVTPIFEPSNLFARSLGETTDIVEKEMYTFSPGSDSLTLRPEGTAGVVRAILQNSLLKEQSFLKLWYHGPMFRRERPQKGRQRQFHQIGVEAVGAIDPLLDAEIIASAYHIFAALGVSDGLTLRLNSIGCPENDCRPKYRQLLKDAIKPHLHEFCQNCQNRFDRNVLRILDCKNPHCQAKVKNLPKSHEHLCDQCKSHFDTAQEGLQAQGLTYNLDPTLVRGLDYYTKTVFEFTHSALGGQDAIGGGGRYDGLVEQLGGTATPGVGYALGIERILLALEEKQACACAMPLMFYGIALGESAHRAMAGVLARLRQAGYTADMGFLGRSLKSEMRTADKKGALFALILGENELTNAEIIVKDLRQEQSSQQTFSLWDLTTMAQKLLPEVQQIIF